jgi:hypothetical protein
MFNLKNELIDMHLALSLAQLRHLYTELNDGYVKYPKELANGLLAPQIVRLEKVQMLLEKLLYDK